MRNEKVISNFIKALKTANKSCARVGILNDTARNDSFLTNAEIGEQHEFGIGVPQRSFLRMPIANHLQEKIDEAYPLNKKTLEQIVSEKSFYPLLKKLGSLGHEVVMDAFDSGGYGTWKPLSPLTIALKGSDTILIDTFQLKDSVDWDVVNA